jgi:hypothetical protein
MTSIFGRVVDVLDEYNNNFFGNLKAHGFDY